MSTRQTATTAKEIDSTIDALEQKRRGEYFVQVFDYCQASNRYLAYSKCKDASTRAYMTSNFAINAAAEVEQLEAKLVYAGSQSSSKSLHLLGVIHNIVPLVLTRPAFHTALFDRYNKTMLMVFSQSGDDSASRISHNKESHYISLAFNYSVDEKSIPEDAPSVEKCKYVQINADALFQEAQMRKDFALGDVTEIRVSYIGHALYPSSTSFAPGVFEKELTDEKELGKQLLETRRELDDDIDRYVKYAKYEKEDEEDGEIFTMDE